MRKGISILMMMGCLIQLACGQNYSRTSAQRVYTAASIPTMSDYLFKDSDLFNLIDIGPGAVRVFASVRDRGINRPEFIVYADEYEKMTELLLYTPMDELVDLYIKKGTKHWPRDFEVDLPEPHAPFDFGYNPEKPLAGLRVALDPGHIAGDTIEADLEGKYVKMRNEELPTGDGIGVRFFEAELTLATAHLTKDKLEELGAQVFLTRAVPGRSAEGMSFSEWKLKGYDLAIEEEYALGRMTIDEAMRWRRGVDEKDMFKLFNNQDLRRRAKAINQFRPHLTCIIHYNVDYNNYQKRDEEGFQRTTVKNYSMAFVPGSFLTEELSTVEDRIHLLRMVLTNQIEESILLSRYFIDASQEYTEVFPVAYNLERGTVPVGTNSFFPKPELPYLDQACVFTGIDGVFARNLSLTRLVRTPLVYGESLCQDNIEEARRLNIRDMEVEGRWVSSRVQDVANAYVDAILKYAASIRE